MRFCFAPACAALKEKRSDPSDCDWITVVLRLGNGSGIGQFQMRRDTKVRGDVDNLLQKFSVFLPPAFGSDVVNSLEKLCASSLEIGKIQQDFGRFELCFGEIRCQIHMLVFRLSLMSSTHERIYMGVIVSM